MFEQIKRKSLFSRGLPHQPARERREHLIKKKIKP